MTLIDETNVSIVSESGIVREQITYLSKIEFLKYLMN